MQQHVSSNRFLFYMDNKIDTQIVEWLFHCLHKSRTSNIRTSWGEKQLGQIKERLDNRKAEIIGLNGFGRVGWIIMSTPLGGVDILFLLFPASAVTLGFQSFQGKVFILSLPNLVWVFIGLIACMGLLLVKIAL